MTRTTRRIEPTLSSEPEKLDEHLQQAAYANQHQARRHSAKKNDLTQQIMAQVTEKASALFVIVKRFCLDKVFINKRINIIIAAIISALVLISLIVSLFSAEPEVVDEPVVEPIETLTTVNLNNRHHKVTLPDNFSVLATDYNGIVISWQAETSQAQKLWDIQTTEGDKSCQAITFNNGESYRSLNVLVENGQQYFANFSPLDNASIVKAIALRGSFNLCGYNFSLKGSQAVLGKHPFYSELLIN